MTTIHAMLMSGVLAGFAALQPASTKPSTAPPPADALVQFTPPPGAATPEEKKLVEEAEALLKSKKAEVSAVLTDPKYMPVHARTEFREVIAAHATAKPLTISGPDEPGTRLSLTIAFLDADGRPFVDALVYLYHTSAKGWYSDKAAHIQANSGDHKHARLFGYVRTDKKGEMELKTIRPGGYPKSDLPEHIHLTAKAGSKDLNVSETLFDDDPRLTAKHRKELDMDANVIVSVTKEADGSQRGRAVFKMKFRQEAETPAPKK